MANIKIFIGTVQGTAESIGILAQEIFQDAGHQVSIHLEPELADIQDKSTDFLLVVTSTTGQGMIPPDLEAFYYSCRDNFPLLNQLPFAVLGLGDSSFDDFCEASILMDELLEELQGKRVCQSLQIDGLEHFDPEPVAKPWLEKLVTLIP